MNSIWKCGFFSSTSYSIINIYTASSVIHTIFRGYTMCYEHNENIQYYVLKSTINYKINGFMEQLCEVEEENRRKHSFIGMRLEYFCNLFFWNSKGFTLHAFEMWSATFYGMIMKIWHNFSLISYTFVCSTYLIHKMSTVNPGQDKCSWQNGNRKLDINTKIMCLVRPNNNKYTIKTNLDNFMNIFCIDNNCNSDVDERNHLTCRHIGTYNNIRNECFCFDAVMSLLLHLDKFLF